MRKKRESKLHPLSSTKISKPRAIKTHPYYTWTLPTLQKKKTKQKWSKQFVVLPYVHFIHPNGAKHSRKPEKYSLGIP